MHTEEYYYAEFRRKVDVAIVAYTLQVRRMGCAQVEIDQF